MKIKKILIVLILSLVGLFVSNVSLKAHNNMDNTNQVVPSTDILIGDIYIPKLFDFSYDEYTVSFVEYFQGGLFDSVDYNYSYNGFNRVGSVPFFTENGVQLFSQYASSFRFVADMRVIDVGNNIDYTTQISLFLPFIKYANNYPSIYELLSNDSNYEYIYFCTNTLLAYPVYVLDNDNRSYEITFEINYIFMISSNGNFNSDEVQLRVIPDGRIKFSDVSFDAEFLFTDLYVDFYVPNVILAKDFGNVRYNDGLAQGYNNGFSAGASGDNGVFSSIGNFLTTSVGGFLNFELFPGFSIMTILGVIIGLILLIIVLKMFMGG